MLPWLQPVSSLVDFPLTIGSSQRSRRDNRSINGTLTLRRSSTNPFGPTTQGDTAPPTPGGSDAAYAQSQTPVTSGDYQTDRYTKNKLLDIYKLQQQQQGSQTDVSRLYVNNWHPGQSNGSNGRGWGKPADARDSTSGPEICWDQTGRMPPIGLEELSEAEREVSRIRLVVAGVQYSSCSRSSPATSTPH